MAGTLTACTAARDTLGTRDSACFDALAIARQAVHQQGTFTGVRQVPLSVVTADARLRGAMARFDAKVHDVCVVSYKGTFDADDVIRLLGPPPPGGIGHYAIVIVSKPQNHVVGTVIRLTQPLRFGHPI